jgi:hypothetical protein
MEDRLNISNLGFAIPNGGKRSLKTAIRLKKTGVKRGVPDLCFPFPMPVTTLDYTRRKTGLVCYSGNMYPGLFIEMKRTRGGSVSQEQKNWIDTLKTRGYRVEVCKGFMEAKDVMLDYFRYIISPEDYNFLNNLIV